ncbi:MAG: hypothetical protein FWG64_06115 [Firmicutes bacterium]|nr:hypothetical protein [Bacillota bacterium]
MTKFEEILKLGQLTLKKRLRSEIVGWSKNSKIADGFLYYAGKLPVLLVAHLDTVHKEPPKLLMYSEDSKIMNDFYGGIGGDDRCGVWMLLQIMRKCKENPPHLLFCEDEEIGGIGAEKFVVSGINPPVNHIIELDRRGDNDAVFYGCGPVRRGGNAEFKEFICNYHNLIKYDSSTWYNLCPNGWFREARGTFSDISVIAPALDLAAVNLSCGFFNEHSAEEYIRLDVMNRNVKRVVKIINAATEQFDYVPIRKKANVIQFGNLQPDFLTESGVNFDDYLPF